LDPYTVAANTPSHNIALRIPQFEKVILSTNG
jgi:hypothetical protein